MSGYAELMASVLAGAGKSFVVFEHGSVVVFVDAAADADLAADALALIADAGPVAAGGPAGDFGVISLPDERGWAVTSHHPDLLTLVLPGEVDDGAADVTIGLYGRSKRGQDAEERSVAHVHDARG